MRRIITPALLLAFSAPCFAVEFNSFPEADAELNRLYKSYSSGLKGAQKKQFVASQRAWIDFKEKDCSFQVSGIDGGSAQSEIIAGCLLNHTKTRIKQIDYYINCQEGDLSCPVW